MARIKIDYGIDLGTTNSAICRMEKGRPCVIKTDMCKDTMPSCVSFTKRKSIKVGDSAYNDMKSDKRRSSQSGSKKTSNAFVEFKRTMATDTSYYSSYMDKEYSSEELSAEVLKTLKSFVIDENISSIVITVPAKFTVNQKTATLEAAKLAGFDQCELLQEPIAAALAYGVSSDKKNGIWMVFDFGGGTFDVALLSVEDGIMQVFDTEGDNYLGGKNLDYAIVDDLIIPYLEENFSILNTLCDEEKKKVLRDAMKTYAEEVKNQLSFKEKEDILSNLGDLGEDDFGDEIELDLTVTQEELFNIIRPYFQKAVDICNDLIKRNNLTGDKIDKIILVGGPTHSPLIRQMLREQISPNVDTSIDPMTAVATGAALYASTIDAKVNKNDLDLDTVYFDISYESTSVDASEWVSIKLTDDSLYSKVLVEFVRFDKAWSSGKIDVDLAGNVIEASLLESKTNLFNILTYDDKGNLLPCFPSEITIIQGAKVGSAPLPYNIGIAIWNENKKCGVFRMATGLEKNKPVPAIGIINNLKTTNNLRPGIKQDILTVPIYQVDDFVGAEGKPVSLYEYVADVVITGEDLNTDIPADSRVEVILKVDTSEQMYLVVHFLDKNINIEKKLDTSKKQSVAEADEIIKNQLIVAQNEIDMLNNAEVTDHNLQNELDLVKQEAFNSYEKKATLQHLKEVLRKIEDKKDSSEWKRLEDEINHKLSVAFISQLKFGNDDSQEELTELKDKAVQIISKQDIFMGKEILKKIEQLNFKLTISLQIKFWVQRWYKDFNDIEWKDPSRARILINLCIKRLQTEESVEIIPEIAELIHLLPESEADNLQGLLR